MVWYKVQFTGDDVLNGKYTRLFKEFLNFSIMLGTPNNMTIFMKDPNSAENDDFCYYIPPESNALIKYLIWVYDGAPCERPPKDQLVLLGGPESAFDTYFPDR